MSQFKVGQIVEITSPSFPDYRAQDRIITVDGSYICLSFMGWRNSATKDIKIIKDVPQPVYENVERDPVAGDVYFVGASVDAEPFVNMWSKGWEIERARNDSRRRVLIYDAVKGETVPGARW